MLSNYNEKIRDEKKIINKECIIRKRDTLLHVCLNSPGCRFRKYGSCTMCNYGQGRMISFDEIEKILQDIYTEINGMDSILLGTLGSIFDPQEIPLKYLDSICNMLNKTPVKVIIFETHYTFIDEKLCLWLKNKMPQKDIVIEMGLESIHDFVQKNCLNKIIKLDAFLDAINLLHHFEISVTVNVFLGAPFLSAKEQITDTSQTILWAIEHGADSVVIFPANIRKNTLLEYLYKEGSYERISQWQVFEVLKRIPIHFLNRIYLSWYGDWLDENENGQIENLPPYSCEACNSKWLSFYQEFLMEHCSKKRKQLIDIIENENQHCKCYQKYQKILDKKPDSWEECIKKIQI